MVTGTPRVEASKVVGAAGQQEDQEQRGQRPARQLHKPGTAKV